MRFPTLALALLALPFAGCDAYTDDNDDGGSFGNDVYVETFAFSGDDLDINSNATVGSYTREVDELTNAVVDDGVVLLYADGDLVLEGNGGTWTPLPFTQGVNLDNDLDVDYTLTYTYSYEEDFLYVDFISSEPNTTFEEFPRTDFRLVLLPGGSGKTGVDYTDYAAVQRAFDLPD